MQTKAQLFISLFRVIVLAGVSALLITSAVLPMTAQNSVPPTAVQAATMPQFAAKLAHGASRISHPAQVRAIYKKPGDAFARAKHGWMPGGNEIYDNGPINGTTDAWTINFGFVVADSFPGNGQQIGGFSFGAWVFPGDVLQSVEISITSEPFGGTTFFDGVVSFSQDGCSGNQYGYNVCTETSASFTGLMMNAGMYWVNLQNAITADGNPVYWDENSGPSTAESNSVGTIPSEAFTVEGNGGNCQPPFCHPCFGPGGNLQVLHYFSQQEVGQNGGPGGVTIDRAGNLYGTTSSGGDNDAGFAYKLSHLAEWLLDPLFSFFGGNNGSGPGDVIVGPNGSLYGGAAGGIQNCGGDGAQYCGVVFNLTPQPTACLTALCSWNENVPYRFSSESDGYGAIVSGAAFDQHGNLYGVTVLGGAFDAGTVFELAPSGAGWTKTTLYNFPAGSDASRPIQVLAGSDGNLYGITNGDAGIGVIFQLMPSGGQWTFSVLHDFASDGIFNADYLVRDSAGNFYGIAQPAYMAGGVIFTLQKTGSNWTFSDYYVQHNGMYANDYLNNLAIDASDRLYGTGDNYFLDEGPISGYIFQASYGSGGWQYQDLDFLMNQNFPSGGSLAFDTSGNLYGTTGTCMGSGASYGTVWQFSP